jgi:hypothetical protein
MQVQELRDVVTDDPFRAEVRAEAIVEPAVWIPDFPGDEPEMEYAQWRDLLFVHTGTEGGG